jgi:acetyl esterase/lipase
MRSSLLLLPLAAWLTSACSGDGGAAAADPCLSPRGVAEVRNDLIYQDLPAVSPRERNLDLYLPARAASCGPAPIVVWVHGGDWGGGDKAELSDSIAAKLTELGYVMASVNYRLSSFMYTQHDPPVTWPTHANDVSVAMAWLRQEAPSFNGDPARMALIGFSAGAQIVANIGTDPRYLESAGLDMSPLRCTASLDVRLYDIPRAAEELPRIIPELEEIFTTDRYNWELASAAKQIKAGAYLRPFFVLRRGDVAGRVGQADDFMAALRAAGGKVATATALDYQHDDVNFTLGEPSDSIIWPALDRFLREDCFPPS